MLNMRQTNDIVELVNKVESLTLKEVKIIAGALKSEHLLRGPVSSVRKKDEAAFTNLIRRVVVGIAALVDKVDSEGYSVPQDGFSVFGWSDEYSTYNSRANEDGSEKVDLEQVCHGIHVPVPLDEDVVYSRGFTGDDGFIDALRYELLTEEDIVGMDLEEVYTLADAYREYLDSDDKFEPGEEEQWSTTERDWELELCWRRQDQKTAARVVLSMQKKTTPGLGYYLHGGKVCKEVSREYNTRKKEITGKLVSLRREYTNIVKRGKNLDLQYNKARRTRAVLLKRLYEVEAEGQELNRELRALEIRVRMVFKYFGRTYSPKAYYAQKAAIANMIGTPRSVYYGDRK